MLVINQKTTSPSFNLALEEYLFKNTNRDYFMLWRNERSIIVGKNQNTYAEINYKYVSENKIPVIRRITGGGAVFHDLGNLNFTFIKRGQRDTFNNYEYFTRPVVELLQSLGVPAELSGRNDLLIKGMKFSGNAQCADDTGILHHGTLLFDADMGSLSQALNVNPLKLKSKSIRSVRSRVTNISEHLAKKITIEEFSDLLIKKIIDSNADAMPYELTPDDIDAVKILERDKYSTWKWNYGSRLPYSYKKEMLFDSCHMEVNLDIKDNKIQSAKIFGDFFGQRDVSELEQALCGVEYREDTLYEIIKEINIREYFSGLSAEQFMKVLM
ncbi:MAG: lipoate--protein ligase [Oscillospiraceae bacterium]|jgi:lipoate-protein ligase A|nr:lipoate--protein ligase [Oscillospiraceae bacterium]